MRRRPRGSAQYPPRFSSEVLVEAGLEFVVGNLFRSDAVLQEHFGAGFDHHGRAAEVKFEGGGVGVVFEELLFDDMMDKPGAAGPFVFRQGLGQGEFKPEVPVY